jgi:hypothetical protein
MFLRGGTRSSMALAQRHSKFIRSQSSKVARATSWVAMPALDQMSDTVPPKFFSMVSCRGLSSLPTVPFLARELANDLRSFCCSNRCSLLRHFNDLVELWTAPRPQISAAAKRCRHHGRTDDRRGRRIRIDRAVVGIHDLRSPAAV